jgi:hypothetical protein
MELKTFIVLKIKTAQLLFISTERQQQHPLYSYGSKLLP